MPTLNNAQEQALIEEFSEGYFGRVDLPAVGLIVRDRPNGEVIVYAAKPFGGFRRARRFASAQDLVEWVQDIAAEIGEGNVY